MELEREKSSKSSHKKDIQDNNDVQLGRTSITRERDESSGTRRDAGAPALIDHHEDDGPQHLHKRFLFPQHQLHHEPQNQQHRFHDVDLLVPANILFFFARVHDDPFYQVQEQFDPATQQAKTSFFQLLETGLNLLFERQRKQTLIADVFEDLQHATWCLSWSSSSKAAALGIGIGSDAEMDLLHAVALDDEDLRDSTSEEEAEVDNKSCSGGPAAHTGR
ncbi:unnamed protein product, partial [Amoebophrya sp. A120]|eukprot:GSA120T00022925001.1